MTVARHYVMIAKEGQSADLDLALRNLAAALGSVPGSEGVDMLRDRSDKHRFLFIEKWASVEAHKDAGQHVPKDVLAPLGKLLAGAPDGGYYDYVLTA